MVRTFAIFDSVFVRYSACVKQYYFSKKIFSNTEFCLIMPYQIQKLFSNVKFFTLFIKRQTLRALRIFSKFFRGLLQFFSTIFEISVQFLTSSSENCLENFTMFSLKWVFKVYSSSFLNFFKVFKIFFCTQFFPISLKLFQKNFLKFHHYINTSIPKYFSSSQ